MKADFDRYNHILIPATHEERSKWRTSKAFRVLRPIVSAYSQLSREGRAIVLIAVLATFLSLEVLRSDAYLFWGALVSLVLSSLAFGRVQQLDGVTVSVVAPRRVTVGDELALALVVRSDAKRPIESLRVDGPFLPWDGQWTAPRAALALLVPGKTERLELRARFRERGEHHLDPFHAGALLPLGLATGPTVSAAGPRFLVVPRIAPVARVPLPRGGRHQPGGVALASKTGESRDLLRVRPYRPGDPVRDLHAKSSARVGYPVVREYQQEHFTRIGVVLDTDLAGGPEDRLEAAIEVAAGVVAHLTRGEALVDLLAAGSDVHSLTLGRSLGSLDAALDLLACVRGTGPFDAEALNERLEPHLPRLSALVMIALRWDDAREGFADRVRGHGVGFRGVVIGDEGDCTSGIASVTIEAVRRGEPLVL